MLVQNEIIYLWYTNENTIKKATSEEIALYMFFICQNITLRGRPPLLPRYHFCCHEVSS